MVLIIVQHETRTYAKLFWARRHITIGTACFSDFVSEEVGRIPTTAIGYVYTLLYSCIYLSALRKKLLYVIYHWVVCNQEITQALGFKILQTASGGITINVVEEKRTKRRVWGSKHKFAIFMPLGSKVVME